MGSKSRGNSNIPNRLSVADRTELLTKTGIREGEVILQRDIGLLYTWTGTQGVDNGGTILNVGIGSWISEILTTVTPSMFGAYVDDITKATINTKAFNDAMKWCGANGKKFYVDEGIWYIDNAIYTPSNLYMEFNNNGWVKPTEFSNVGGMLTNVVSSAHPEYGATGGGGANNITIIGARIDCELLPYDTTVITKNDNCIGFAREAHNILVKDSYVKNCHARFSSNGTGGKGINFEHGVRDSQILGFVAENCYTGVYINGLDGEGTLPATYAKGVYNIDIDNVLAINCESALTLASIDSTAVAPNDPDINKVHVGSVVFRNCGYQITADTNIATHYQKGGAINIAGSRNIVIDSIVGHNDDAYAPYSIAGLTTDHIAYGITDPYIGAVVWGHGNNIEIGNIAYNGNAESLVHIGMCLGIGDSNAPAGLVDTIDNFNINNATIYNNVGTLFEGDQYYPITDGTAYNINANITIGKNATTPITYTDTILDNQVANTRLKVTNATNVIAEGSMLDLQTNLTSPFAHSVNTSYINGYIQMPYIDGELLHSSGSNANGRWYKFESGLLICAHEKTGNAPNLTAGALFASLTWTWTYPEVFIVKPTISGSTNISKTQWLTGGGTTTTASLKTLSYISSSSISWVLTAIGRWK